MRAVRYASCAMFVAALELSCGGTPQTPTAASLPVVGPPAAKTGIVQGIVKHEGFVSHGLFPEGPLAGAQVVITEGPGAGLSVTTGADGVYRFELPLGPFRVRWSWPGNETRDSDPGTIVAGTTMTLDVVILRQASSLPIPEWSIAGTVRDGAGNPIAAAAISVED